MKPAGISYRYLEGAAADDDDRVKQSNPYRPKTDDARRTVDHL